MKKSELRQIIKEEIQNVLINEAFVNPQGELEDFDNGRLIASLLTQYKGKSGKTGLIISKFLVLEKVLKQLKTLKASDPNAADEIKTIDMILNTFNEIREI